MISTLLAPASLQFTKSSSLLLTMTPASTWDRPMDDLLNDFLTETSESLAELDLALVRLEQNPRDAETLSSVFRLVHTIKGTCGFLGLPRLESIAHAAENVLGRLRDKELVATAAIVTLVLSAIDRIKLVVRDIGSHGSEQPGDDSALITVLGAIASGETITGADPGASPDPETAANEVPSAAPSTQTIRVSVEVLENLITLVSELVLTRNQLLQLARVQEDNRFVVPLQRLSQITSDLQEGVMKTRMQPIGNAWNKLPRLVRDLAHELGKKIDLAMHGTETELDRQVLELIKDPLTHMVRNSADHGLESPQDRRRAGKPETGHIGLKAYHEGGHIIIEVADDGRGLSVERIRAKAIAQGLSTEAELAGMSDEQIQAFIFRPGFSTAASVTSVSGRGVGMDVVKTNIERIGGTIVLNSTAGQGTRFSIKIPLTLAIVSALIVQAGVQRFAIPQISVMELVRATKDHGSADGVIERINQTQILRLRNRLLPLVSLHSLLGMESAATLDEPTILVTQAGSGMIGILVDRVFDTEEIVVKPVAPILRNLSVFAGNTILGDGSVIMILDPNGIARQCGINAEASSTAGSEIAGDHSADNIAMLVFRGGNGALMAVPLERVARIEELPADAIEVSTVGMVTQYRDRLMPLIAIADQFQAGRSRYPVLVFSQDGRNTGLIVGEIIDVVDHRSCAEMTAGMPGLLGSAVIAGRANDIVDVDYWLDRAWNQRSVAVSEAVA